MILIFYITLHDILFTVVAVVINSTTGVVVILVHIKVPLLHESKEYPSGHE